MAFSQFFGDPPHESVYPLAASGGQRTRRVRLPVRAESIACGPTHLSLFDPARERRMSRGKGKASIRDLYHIQPTTDEKNSIIDTLEKTVPVACAILGASMVEHELDIIIRERMNRKDDATWKALIGENGPLYSFSQKIELGYALRLYDDTCKKNLTVVKNIRNVFAHAKVPIEFENPLIQREFKRATEWQSFKKDFRFYVKNNTGCQPAYASLCILLACELIKRGTLRVAAQSYRMKRQISNLRRRRIAQLLASHPQSNQGLNRLLTLAPQNADPTQKSPGSKLGGLLGLGADILRKSGTETED